MPELDANANAVAIETLTLHCEGWELDDDVDEPSEPVIDEPSAGACSVPSGSAP